MSDSPRAIRRAAAGLSLAALVAYHNSFGVPFLFDDEPAIIENASIRHLTNLSDLLWPALEGGVTTAGRPLVNLSFALNFAASGTDVWSYHAVNLLVHVLAGLTLFGVIRRTLIRLDSNGSAGASVALPLALAIAALWMLHPIQTAAVTYIVQRAESLTGLLCLLTLYAFIRSTTSGRPGNWLTLSVAACLLAMASKEVAVVAPLVVLLYDRTFVAGSFGEAWRRRARYYAGLAATWVLLGLLVSSTGGRGDSAGFESIVTPARYLLTQFYAIPHYLRLVVWPNPLVFDYGTGTVAGIADVWWQTLLLLAMGAGTVVALYRGSPSGFVGAWFFAWLAPSSSIVPVASQTIAEHRMYLALAAPVTLAAVALYRWLGRRAFAAWTLLMATSIGLTVARNGDFSSEASIWADTLAKRPENGRAHQNFGLVELKQGRVNEALAHVRRGIDLQPDRPEGHYNLGVILAELGRHDEALPAYERALALAPGYERAHNNLANSLLALGRRDEAIPHYVEALRLRPTYGEAHSNYANLLLEMGRRDEALGHAEEAVRLGPSSATIQFNTGNAYAAAGRFREAVVHYREAIALRPGYPEAHFNAGNALLAMERDAEALAHLEEAVRQRPGYVEARRALGLVLLKTGRAADARPHLEAVARARPDDGDVATALARVTAMPSPGTLSPARR